MTEPTPPPERPLPDQARARIRAQLLAGAQQSRAPRWVVPAGAAAAVALVAGMGYWAVSPGGDSGNTPVGGGDSPSAPVVPSAVPPSEPSETSGTAQPSASGPSRPGTVPSNVPSVSTDPVEAGTGTCRDELANVLKGAQQTYQFPPTGGAVPAPTSFWVKGDRFALCDVRDGITTVHQPLPLTPREDVETYRVSSYHPGPGNLTVRVAGGIVPAGSLAYDVAYTFPDGHTEAATEATDDQGRTWWRMVYAYDDGGGNELRKPPIEVTVSYSGAQYHYSLEWGVDTCAQANHGC